MPGSETGSQRLDKWLWCARFLRTRASCAALVASRTVRINRQATDKPHARLTPGDVLTLALPGRVQVVRVLALAERRGRPEEAHRLYETIDGAPTSDRSPPPPNPLPQGEGESSTRAPSPGGRGLGEE